MKTFDEFLEEAAAKEMKHVYVIKGKFSNGEEKYHTGSAAWSDWHKDETKAKTWLSHTAAKTALNTHRGFAKQSGDKHEFHLYKVKPNKDHYTKQSGARFSDHQKTDD